MGVCRLALMVESQTIRILVSCTLVLLMGSRECMFLPKAAFLLTASSLANRGAYLPWWFFLNSRVA